MEKGILGSSYPQRSNTGAYRRPWVAGGSEDENLPVRLSSELYGQMLDHLRSELPNEGCGLIAFEDNRPVKIYPGTNVLASQTRYRMDDEEVIRAVDDMEAQGWWLGGIYHSHPASPAVPSATDLREASWPDARMLITSLSGSEPDVRAYRISRSAYQQVPIIVDQPRPGLVAGLIAYGRQWFGLAPSSSARTSVSAAGGSVREADADALANTEQPRTVVGILGGMGPAATADLYSKIIAATPAEVDQDHIPVVIYSDPRVPDRSEALLHGGEDPTPWLIRGANQLFAMGADFIVVPCNTAHAFLDPVRKAVPGEILSMIEIAAESIRRDHPDTRTVGLLATSGTIRSEMYQQALERRKIATIVPDEDIQRHQVMPSIRAIKANFRQDSVRSQLVEAAESLEQRGAHVILAACTEIPVVLKAEHLSSPLVDATETLARRVVQEALQRDELIAAEWQSLNESAAELRPT